MITKDYRITTIMDQEVYERHLDNLKKAGIRLRGTGAKVMEVNAEIFNMMLEILVDGDMQKEYFEILEKHGGEK